MKKLRFLLHKKTVIIKNDVSAIGPQNDAQRPGLEGADRPNAHNSHVTQGGPVTKKQCGKQERFGAKMKKRVFRASCPRFSPVTFSRPLPSLILRLVSLDENARISKPWYTAMNEFLEKRNTFRDHVFQHHHKYTRATRNSLFFRVRKIRPAPSVTRKI